MGRNPKRVIVMALVLLAISAAVLARGGDLHNPQDLNLEAGHANDLLNKELAHTTANNGSSFLLLLSSDSLKVTDGAFKSATEAALGRLQSDARITQVRTPYNVPADQAPGYVSNDGHTALTVVEVKDPELQAARYYPQLRDEVRSDSLRVLATGGLAVQTTFNKTLAADVERAEIFAIPLTIIFLMLVFGALIAAGLPLGIGILSIIGGVGGVYGLAHFTDVSQYAINIVTLVGLGVSIDYSLFIVNRYREELAVGDDRAHAISRTMATAGRAITFSGITVAIGLGGMLFYTGSFLPSMGMAGGLVVAIAVFYSLTILPALLVVLGPRINSLGLPLGIGRGGGRAWHALAMAVMRRPVVVLVPTVGLIVAAGIPFTHLRLANGDINQLPAQAEVRRGAELLTSAFPNRDRTTIQVVAEFPGSPSSPGRVAAVAALGERLATLPNVLRVVPGGSGGHVAEVDVLTTRPAQSDAARNIVRAIRADRRVGDGTVEVTGQTAFDLDIVDYIVGRTPLAVGFIVVVTCVVLFLLLGSMLLPIKAVIMNFLSLSASFGALVFIFQDGHFEKLLNFTPDSIDPSVPVILFCIVFGLSMDYEVLLMSRMKEEFDRTGDNRLAVASGLERSGRLITGAAAIMFVVFLGFGLADVLLIKAIGLGMAIAVLIDATVVRALIVPATMRLLGNLNWWAPAPLRQVYLRLGLSETGKVTAPVTVKL